jgi:transposase
LTGQFFLNSYPQGNGTYTVSFLKDLLEQRPDSKMLVIWDGGSYHKSQEMQDYLTSVNAGLDETDWRISCVLLAPHAPEQNPVEDIWRKGKTFLRKHFYENKTFAYVAESFFNFLNGQIFDFPFIIIICFLTSTNQIGKLYEDLPIRLYGNHQLSFEPSFSHQYDINKLKLLFQRIILGKKV